MPKRRWPTVPEILRRAARVETPLIGQRPDQFIDRETGEAVKIHAATLPLVLKSITGWRRQESWNLIVYHRPEAP